MSTPALESRDVKSDMLQGFRQVDVQSMLLLGYFMSKVFSLVNLVDT